MKKPEPEIRGKRGFYSFRYSFPGVGQKWVALGTKNERDATTRANRFVATAAKDGFVAAKEQLDGVPVGTAKGGTVEQVEKLYTEFCEKGNNPVSDLTRKCYLSALRRVADWCGTTLVAELDDIKAKQGWRQENPLGKETSFRGLMKSAASVFSKSAITFYRKNGVTIENPLAGMKLVADDIQPYLPLPFGVRDKIEADCRSELEPAQTLIVLLALKLGLRSGEIAAARLEWLRQTGPRQWVFRVKEEADDKFKPKGRELRDFPVADTLAREILSLRGESVSHYLVPNNLTGKQRLKSEAAFVTMWLRLKGIKERRPVHTMRKECGSVLATTYNLLVASRVLGHHSITVTEKYYASLVIIPTIGEEFALSGVAAQYGIEPEKLRDWLESNKKAA